MRNTHQWTGHTKSRSIAQDIHHWNTNNCVFSHLSTESFIFSSCCSNLSPQLLPLNKNWMIAMPVEMELHTHLCRQGIYFVYLTLSPCQVIRFQMYTPKHTAVMIIKCFDFCSISSKRFGWNTSPVLNDNLHNVWLTECFPALVKWKTLLVCPMDGPTIFCDKCWNLWTHLQCCPKEC